MRDPSADLGGRHRGRRGHPTGRRWDLVPRTHAPDPPALVPLRLVDRPAQPRLRHHRALTVPSLDSIRAAEALRPPGHPRRPAHPCRAGHARGPRCLAPDGAARSPGAAAAQSRGDPRVSGAATADLLRHEAPRRAGSVRARRRRGTVCRRGGRARCPRYRTGRARRRGDRPLPREGARLREQGGQGSRRSILGRSAGAVVVEGHEAVPALWRPGPDARRPDRARVGALPGRRRPAGPGRDARARPRVAGEHGRRRGRDARRPARGRILRGGGQALRAPHAESRTGVRRCVALVRSPGLHPLAAAEGTAAGGRARPHPATDEALRPGPLVASARSARRRPARRRSTHRAATGTPRRAPRPPCPRAPDGCRRTRPAALRSGRRLHAAGGTGREPGRVAPPLRTAPTIDPSFSCLRERCSHSRERKYPRADSNGRPTD